MSGVAFTAHGPEIPVEWRDLWASALGTIEIGMRSPQREYEVREMLEALAASDPDIAEAWIRSALADTEYVAGALPYDADEYLHKLPRPNRDRLLRSTTGWNRSQLLETLIGTDAEWAEALIRDHTVTADQVLDALAGRIGPSLEVFLPILLANGISPEKAASRAHLQRVWVGSESNQYAELREYFATLANTSNAPVAAVGKAGAEMYTRAFKGALKEEKAERIKGK